MRSVLKQQMSDRDETLRRAFIDKIQESVVVSERDSRDRREDAEKFDKRFTLLKSYRDENKKVCEAGEEVVVCTCTCTFVHVQYYMYTVFIP